jgi:hypothetical protein
MPNAASRAASTLSSANAPAERQSIRPHAPCKFVALSASKGRRLAERIERLMAALCPPTLLCMAAAGPAIDFAAQSRDHRSNKPSQLRAAGLVVFEAATSTFFVNSKRR